jgi:2-amino-4-hydroxy-6-hydroxymethyldihydropteridine diphosphokinase
MTGVHCFVALGANLGAPVDTVKAALVVLSELPQAKMVAASSLYRTAPIGLPPGVMSQPDFINAVVEMTTVLPAPTFLAELFAIEARFGRQRNHVSPDRNASRTLDLDLLLYGDMRSTDSHLTLPHPRMHQRAFVLAPLAEIAPHLIIPGLGAVRDLLAQNANQRVEQIYPSMVI